MAEVWLSPDGQSVLIDGKAHPKIDLIGLHCTVNAHISANIKARWAAKQAAQ